MIRKIILGIVFLVVLISVVTCGISIFERRAKQLPPVDEALYQVATTSRIYYSNEVVYSEANDSYTMSGYWHIQKEKWVYSDDTITLNVAVYGPVEVSARK